MSVLRRPSRRILSAQLPAAVKRRSLALTSFLCSRSSAPFNLPLLLDLPCMIANSLLRLKGGGGVRKGLEGEDLGEGGEGAALVRE